MPRKKDSQSVHKAGERAKMFSADPPKAVFLEAQEKKDIKFKGN